VTRMVCASVLCLAVLGGCASATRQDGEWVKTGVSEQQRERDQADCLVSATRGVPGSTTGSRRAYDAGRYETCMTDRGYARASVR
jgi:hypothetical protein